MRAQLWGPRSSLGAWLALMIFAFDQFSKFWVLRIVNLDERPPIPVAPFLDLAMTWNRGVSYGLLPTHMQGLLIALSLLITAGLWLWLAGTKDALAAASLGIVIGGALGNALDRSLHGAVADFFHLHWGNWSWYVFNLADVAIVAGVILLVYDSFAKRQKD